MLDYTLVKRHRSLMYTCTHMHVGGRGGWAPMRVYDSYTLWLEGCFAIPRVTCVTVPIGGHLVSLGSPSGVCLPFNFVSPVRCWHRSFGYVGCVTGLKWFASLGIRCGFTSLCWWTTYSLLTEPYCFDFVSATCHDNMGLRRVTGGSFRFVVSCDPSPS